MTGLAGRQTRNSMEPTGGTAVAPSFLMQLAPVLALCFLTIACGGTSPSNVMSNQVEEGAEGGGSGSSGGGGSDGGADVGADSPASEASATAEAGASGAASDGPSGADGNTSCGSTECAQGEVCVVETTSGGACLLPDDAGTCPAGTTYSGHCCGYVSTTYSCKPWPSGCGTTLSCVCAKSLCSDICQSATGNELECLIAAP